MRGTKTARKTARGCWLLIAGSSMIAAALVSAPLASASSSKVRTCTSGAGTKVTGASACQGLAYYKGKSVTFISISTPGEAYDFTSRDLSPYLSTFLNASVETEDIANGGTIGGQDASAAAPPNGLTIGEANALGTVLGVAVDSPIDNFNLSREAFIGGISQGAEVLAVNPTQSSVTTFRQLVTTSGVRIMDLSQGQPFLTGALLNAVWGAHVSWIFGFNGPNPLVQGIVSGDAPFGIIPLGNVGPLIKSGVVRPIFTSQKAPKGLTYANQITGVLTPAEAAKQIPPKTKAEKKDLAVGEDAINAANILIIMPSATPGPDVQVVRDAVTWAMKQPALQVEMLNEGMSDRLISGSAAKSAYLGVVKNMPILRTIMSDMPTSSS